MITEATAPRLPVKQGWEGSVTLDIAAVGGGLGLQLGYVARMGLRQCPKRGRVDRGVQESVRLTPHESLHQALALDLNPTSGLP